MKFNSNFEISDVYPSLCGTVVDWAENYNHSYYEFTFDKWWFVGPDVELYGHALHEAMVDRIGGCEELAGWIVIRHDWPNVFLRLGFNKYCVDLRLVVSADKCVVSCMLGNVLYGNWNTYDDWVLPSGVDGFDSVVDYVLDCLLNDIGSCHTAFGL